MEKEQKKISLPKLIIVLVLLGLLLTSLLGRTLAKYITTGTIAKDTVRVAKWGVTVNASGELFKKEYITNDTTYSGGISVKADDLVFAPGTNGQTAGVTISGQPEVASRISIKDNGSSVNGWDQGEAVLWTLEVEGVPIVNGGSLHDLIGGMTANSIDLAPNADLSGAGFNISWEWPFGDGTNDVRDTYYGDKTTAPTVNFDFDIVIEQID